MGQLILFVEDDEVHAQLVKVELLKQGYTVHHVEDGNQALEAIQGFEYDAIITDQYMPIMTGTELLHELNKLGIVLPVIVMTAAEDVSLAFSVLKLGAAEFVVKDLKGNYLDLLGAMLSKAIAQYRLHTQTVKLKQQLELEQQISHATMDAFSQGVVVFSADHKVIYCNKHFKLLFGLPLDEDVAGSELKWLVNLCVISGFVNDTQDHRQAHQIFKRLCSKPFTPVKIKLPQSILEIQCSSLMDAGFVLTFADISHQIEQQEQLNRIISLAPVAIVNVEKNGKIVLANEKACELLCVEQNQIKQLNISRFIPDEYRLGYQQLINQCLETTSASRESGGVDLELLDINGQQIPVEISISSFIAQHNQHFLATIVDISHRKQAEREIKSAHQLTQSIIDQSPFSIVATDIHGEIISVSPALESMLWYDRKELVNRKSATFFHQSKELENRAYLLSQELNCDIEGDFQVLIEKARRGVVDSAEWNYVRKDGSTLPVNLTVTQLRSNDDTVTGFILVAQDISEQKRAQEYIQHIAHHDALTGLPNRVLMQDRLHNALLRAKRQKTKLAVLVMDLDHFKRINDTLGHLAGDELLKTVARRLNESVRESDTVCRMGGDEFVVMLPDIHDPGDVDRICSKIVEFISKPIAIGLNNLTVSPSIGYSLYPEHGSSSEDLIKHADVAMYEVKQSGRRGFKEFHHDLMANNLKALALEQGLHEAFSKNKLELFYQPKVDAVTGRVVGVEALLRWIDDQQGLIPPGQFIPMAESSGFIVTLGDWVLRRACNEIQQLNSQLGFDLGVAVNVSPRQLEHAGFIRSVKAALQDSGLPPEKLELEITENLLMENSDMVTGKLQALYDMNVNLAIDDFGTGYSNLAYVARYPINILKIDRQFMALEKRQNLAIISAIVAIAKGLELEIVAEGVETETQLAAIRTKGCHLAQGFYFAPAVPCSELFSVIQDIHSNKPDIEKRARTKH